ncbi:ROK family transcriptional regulator [Arthrobacter castelli]|uniref:ROK family transcriptional regulator n=1 Tax=Arthrobacter castelli TaxID=271431 RepID=UPI000423242A|nr:ROK family transcriptional regulator [Arthrobacter castelli]
MVERTGGNRPGSQSALHTANRRRIVELLQSAGEMTQAQVSRATGLAPATVSNITRELTSEGVLIAVDPGVGRKGLRLAPAAGLVAAIDYGHRHVTVAIADMAHEILAERRSDLETGTSASESLECASLLLEQALADLDVDRFSITAAGMGLPAPIDSRTGEVGALSILPGWVGVDPAKMVSDRLNVPVGVDNDANLGVLAEHLWGAGSGFDNIALLKLSDGVGAGLVLNGALFHGRDGTAGEIGHTMMDEAGAVCRCGNRGCLETMAATRSVTELLEPRFGPALTIQDIVGKAIDGDTACARILSDVGRHTGVALANLCNLFNPDRILIGGELAQAGELLLAPMREAVGRGGIPSATDGLEILPSGLGARGPILGAIALALRRAPSPV